MLGSELDSTTSEQFIDYKSKGNGCTKLSLAMTSKRYDSGMKEKSKALQTSKSSENSAPPN